MPLHYYAADGTMTIYPYKQFPQELIESYEPLLLSQETDIAYITSKNFLYVGLIRNPKTQEKIILGPISSTTVSDRDISVIINEASISIEYTDMLFDYFRTTPLFTFYQFLNILALISRELLAQEIDIYDYFRFTNSSKNKEVNQQVSKELYERKEQENYHNTYQFEQEYYGYVEAGDSEGLQRFLQNMPALTVGNVANNSLRQEKNIFISAITMITRKSISGGLDIETAYQLSDSYIQEMEKMSDVTEITLLNMTAIMDFTNRVREAKIPVDMSPTIYKAIQYISNHTNQPITVEDVAEELGLNRSTLSKKFKQELGFNISDYIMRRKLEEAKSLLHYTDKSISEISEYLCFSTQSYFQNVFKKKYGMTPREYRNTSI